jgi:hypothetical protein
MATKILALTDALGPLVRFVLLPGHRFDTVGVPPQLQRHHPSRRRRHKLTLNLNRP